MPSSAVRRADPRQAVEPAVCWQPSGRTRASRPARSAPRRCAKFSPTAAPSWSTPARQRSSPPATCRAHATFQPERTGRLRNMSKRSSAWSAARRTRRWCSTATDRSASGRAVLASTWSRRDSPTCGATSSAFRCGARSAGRPRSSSTASCASTGTIAPRCSSTPARRRSSRAAASPARTTCRPTARAEELAQAPLPRDDFNSRVVLFGRDFAQARKLAEALSTTPFHNILYFPGSYEALAAAIRSTGKPRPADHGACHRPLRIRLAAGRMVAPDRGERVHVLFEYGVKFADGRIPEEPFAGGTVEGELEAAGPVQAPIRAKAAEPTDPASAQPAPTGGQAAGHRPDRRPHRLSTAPPDTPPRLTRRFQRQDIGRRCPRAPADRA